MQITVNAMKNIPSGVIIDGVVIRGNLKELGITEDWLTEQMQAQGITEIKEILYAEVQSDGSIIFQRKCNA